MNHQIDTNDLEYAEKRYGKLIGWIPGAVDKKGKINPQVTMGVREDGKYVSVFHVKPVYYETPTGHWRPLSEVTLNHGNHSIILNENWWQVHPRYLNWLDKRCKLIGGELLIPSSLKSYPTPYTGIVRSLHESLVPLKIGLTTTTVYPDPDPESTTVDGRVYRGSVSESWATIRAGAGSAADNPALDGLYLYGAASSDNYQYLVRGIFLFNTSAIGTDTISSATASWYVQTSWNGLGGGSISVCGSTPASNTNLVAADFTQTGNTKYASDIAIGSLSNGSYNDFSFNATGISNVSKTGVTKLSSKGSIDVDNTTPTWSNGGQNGWNIYFADQSGTTNDPKIVVVHAAAASGPANIKAWNGLAQASVKTVNGLAIASVKTKNGLA